MAKVSVITPVYKSEKYLSECLDSILAQTFKDFELILIDDKSPDNCGAICEEYTAKDNRVRVIHNEQNLGVTTAKKTGLNAAKGEYVLFVDSDDWIYPSMIEKLYNAMIETNADMVYCDYIRRENDENKYVSIGLIENDRDARVATRLIKPGSTIIVLWNKLIKRSFYAQIDFQTNSEDLYITCQILFLIRKFAYVPEALYSYRILNNSISHAKNRRLSYGLTLFNSCVLSIAFLRKFCGNDLSAFEPHLSFRVNKTKRELIAYGFSDIKFLNTLYPEANKNIFDPIFKMKTKKKIYLWLALNLKLAFLLALLRSKQKD
jgi:glycosyltransferase involved in cell wall biosynthesis